jgi:cytochrome c553
MKFNYLIFLVISLSLLSCQNEKDIEVKEPFQMYETSELATLMEEFYVYNDSLKSQILNDLDLTSLPSDFNKIHTAQMTDRFERDESFQLFANLFEKHQKEIYKVSKDSLKQAFNNTIHTCIACHQTTCTGPIPRIQKLLIK